ncbi:hypothetical protein DL96DRAFT_1581733 [Flagelloscypha sp. PMI_526]|nr:hypothetical protein DL96DRAFT_1581733 [Flagelloscypha sp. PMI_526]
MTSEKRREAQRLASARYRANNRAVVNAKCRLRAAEKRSVFANDPDKNRAIGAELQARREASARYYAKNADRIRERSRDRLRNQRAKANLARLEQVKSWAESVHSKEQGSEALLIGPPPTSGYVVWDSEPPDSFLIQNPSSDDGSACHRTHHTHSRSLSSNFSFPGTTSSGGRGRSDSNVSSYGSSSRSSNMHTIFSSNTTSDDSHSHSHSSHHSSSSSLSRPTLPAIVNHCPKGSNEMRPDFSFPPVHHPVPRSLQVPSPGELRRNFSFPTLPPTPTSGSTIVPSLATPPAQMSRWRHVHTESEPPRRTKKDLFVD